MNINRKIKICQKNYRTSNIKMLKLVFDKIIFIFKLKINSMLIKINNLTKFRTNLIYLDKLKIILKVNQMLIKMNNLINFM